MTRLQKYLADCGVASRRAAERLIAEGRVRVNGAPAAVGQSVAPGSDAVEVDGRRVTLPGENVYIVINKPAGAITTARDTHGRKTVLDLVAGAGVRVFPVGRLDMDVEGVLLLTNDGELAFRLTHPRYEVNKVYVACVKGRMLPETAARFSRGVQLEDGMSAPAKAEILKAGERASLVRLTLHEGRKREVKRLCAAVGHPVKRLERVAFGSIQARGMRPGEWRRLTPHEVAALRKLTGLA